MAKEQTARGDYCLTYSGDEEQNKGPFYFTLFETVRVHVRRYIFYIAI